MPNGKCYQPYRIPGAYTCYICRDLKDAEEFYKDSTRYSGCSSRCKKCDDRRREARRSEAYQTDDTSSRRLMKKRMDDIKSTSEGADLIPSVYRKTVQRDAQGLPVWIEKTTHYPNGDFEVVFERVSS